MYANALNEENVKLTTNKRLYVEQNAYMRAQKYHNQLMKNNQQREKELRHKKNEIIKRKQNLILMKGSLPSCIETDKIKKENKQVQTENEIIQNLITKIKLQIKKYNDLYYKLDTDFQNQMLSFQKLEQFTLDNSFTAEQLKNIHLKAINKYEKVFQAENNLINMLFSLQNREKIVLKKEKKLNFILSEPLDNIELDEFLTQNIEDSASELELKDQTDNDISKLINEIEKESIELETISKNNKKKKKNISIQKNYIFSQSQISYSSFIEDSPRKAHDKKTDLVILDQNDKVQINSKIENIMHNLNEKNRKCLTESLEIDQLSIVNIQRSKELEKQFQIKKLKIQNLKDQVEFVHELNSSIKETQNAILVLTRKLSNLNDDKERIKHANSNAFQSRNIYESRKEDLNRLRSLLDIRMKELNEKELKINKRKNQYQKDQAYISSQMIEIEKYEQKIHFLEEQAKEYEEKIRENCNEFNESYSIIDEKSKLSFISDHSIQSNHYNPSSPF